MNVTTLFLLQMLKNVLTVCLLKVYSYFSYFKPFYKQYILFSISPICSQYIMVYYLTIWDLFFKFPYVLAWELDWSLAQLEQLQGSVPCLVAS